jgi:hypothetical protein
MRRWASRKKSRASISSAALLNASLWILRGHVAMDFHGNHRFAERLQGIVQLDLSLVDLEALCLQRMRDVGGGHRSIERIVLANPTRDLDLELSQPLRDRVRVPALLRVAHLGELLLAFDLPFVVVRDRKSKFPRQQIVPRVSLGDLHHVAATAEVIDVFSENDFHDSLWTNP